MQKGGFIHRTTITFDKGSITGEAKFRGVLELSMSAQVNRHAVLEIYGLIEYSDDRAVDRLTGTKIYLNYEEEI